ncbi:hypothetical protein L226DRAFT_549369 [Lentinus tigrinus ALCF2SS1-7]|uniref:uncharacterized protein n=1 Tax=Lentinus tigrinus ALCF2SS1-7 TaxID=1328758 RepID=UPI0011663EE9|nr:hypothetical protein L226DRAFT_549369 [Lentinus tigrinus ALCF2SS1-7]
MPSPPAIRVIVRLPYNRQEDAPADPPRVEWNADKEHILWEVIAKSRAIEGANPDWKGLAQHLQVPLPYLLYRAQVRYEEDLRGLQGLGLRTPSSCFPSVPSPQRIGPAEYFPRMPEDARPPLPHRDSHARLGSSSSATGGVASTSGTVPGTSTLRPHIGVRARLSSLGSAHGRALAQLRSPTVTDHVQSPLSANPVGNMYPRPAKKVSSSSTITLQGPKRPRSPQFRPLSPASSRAGSSSDGAHGGEDTSDEEDESDGEARRVEAEKQEVLARKLKDLERLMTKDALGLVADPAAMSARVNGNGGAKPRGRARPLSGMSASLSSSSAPMDYSRSRNQSLSSASVDSPQGSIPSIPSPALESNAFAQHYPQQSQPHSHTRHHSQGYDDVYPKATNMYHRPARSQSQSLSSHSLSQSRSNSNSHSNPQSPPRLSSPMSMPRHLGTPDKTSSPPALSPGSARGQTSNARVQRTPSGLAAGTPTTGSEASSFSDLSDASVSLSALDSALMSNIKGGGSRLSSFARSHLPSKRSVRN